MQLLAYTVVQTDTTVYHWSCQALSASIKHLCYMTQLQLSVQTMVLQQIMTMQQRMLSEHYCTYAVDIMFGI